MIADFNAYSYLLQHDIKPSVQRLAIVNYLYEHRTHPTADEIYEGLLDEIPTLSKTTVYNTLNLFQQQAAVLALTIDDKNVRFDIDTSDHAHFKCLNCGKVFDVPAVLNSVTSVTLEQGFLVTEKHLYLKGYCSSCNNLSK
ncbi:MAG TPA: transcriptional repressor [Paludibacteraceae bacterium]|nr:transcriptional repressor [Paludibacteraceae bacterium]HRS67320.1 transcriptional repressor [Paludibacteraceae bacterium]